MTIEEYLPEWFFTYLSPIVLLVGGLVALLVVAMYLKDKESTGYKLTVGLGLVVGILIVVLAVIKGYHAETYTLVLITLAAFALIIRPFRDVHIAVIVALLIMVVTYLLLGNFAGVMIGSIDLSFIAEGWPRIIIAFVIGAIIFGLLSFAEAIVKLFGKILNCWPVLLILGVLCIGEACCLYLGYGSIFDYIRNIPWNSLVPQ